MYCNFCGVQIQPGQNFCSSCGKPVGTAAPTIGGQQFAVATRSSRLARHVQTLGILWLVYSAFTLFEGIIVLGVGRHMFGGGFQFPGPEQPPSFIGPLMEVLGWVIIAKAALGLAAGWGLIQRQPWARILALVIGIISLFLNIPFGTAIGIYTIWVLMSADAGEEYDRMAHAV